MPIQAAAVAAQKPRKTRKRHDPADAPIHGMQSLEGVINQNKGFVYAKLTPKDAARKRWQGYRRVERSGDGPQPKYWEENEYPGYREGELTLYEIPKALHAQHHAAQVAISDQRMAGIGYKARESGGEHKTRVST
jgi:hypothetical protein